MSDNNIDFSVFERTYEVAAKSDATPSDAFILCSDGELHSILEDDPPIEVKEFLEFVGQHG
jgi:hypothetical protein